MNLPSEKELIIFNQIKNELIKLLENHQSKDDEYIIKLLEFCNSFTIEKDKLSSNPRDDKAEDNAKILYLITTCLSYEVENLYGKLGSTYDISTEPHFFSDQQRSQIFMIKKVYIGIGTDAQTWEDVFYQISHEVLHLLNPCFNLKEEKVCRLEEAVAVKFAESMYRKYIHKDKYILNRFSPLNDDKSEYFQSYYRVQDIPNDILKNIRTEFGSFSQMDDFTKFYDLVKNYINTEDAEFLFDSFKY